MTQPKMRAGFIGTGSFAGAHARSLGRIGVDIAGCFGTNERKTKAFSEEHGCSHCLDLHNRSFIQAASAGNPQAVLGDHADAVKSLEAVLAMNRSAAKGESVEI